MVYHVLLTKIFICVLSDITVLKYNKYFNIGLKLLFFLYRDFLAVNLLQLYAIVV